LNLIGAEDVPKFTSWAAWGWIYSTPERVKWTHPGPGKRAQHGIAPMSTHDSRLLSRARVDGWVIIGGCRCGILSLGRSTAAWTFAMLGPCDASMWEWPRPGGSFGISARPVGSSPGLRHSSRHCKSSLLCTLARGTGRARADLHTVWVGIFIV